MKIRFPKKITAFFAAVACGISLVFAWGAWGHQRINRAAVFALPESMGSFFYNHIDFVTEEATVPDLRKYTLGDKSESPRHFINLESFRDDLNTDSLPQTMPDARARYGESFLQSNGMLPWYIQEITDKLTKAFQNKRKAEILFLAADLGHYVADAYMPLHTSLNHDGALTNQKGIHAFWEGQIPEMFGSNYNFYTGDAKYVQNITRSTWNIINASHRLADTLLAADRRLKVSLPLNKIYQLDSDGEIAKKIRSIFDMRPYGIEQRFNLRTPIYFETAAYGHMGRKTEVKEKIFNKGKKNEKRIKVKLFPWEELNYVDKLKSAFRTEAKQSAKSNELLMA